MKIDEGLGLRKFPLTPAAGTLKLQEIRRLPHSPFARPLPKGARS